MIYIIAAISLITLLYYISVLLAIFGFNKKTCDAENEIQENISVILPVRNEENVILDCIKSLEAQNYDNKNFEVIIVNDHSTDRSIDIIVSYIVSKPNFRLYHLTDKETKKEALKLGVAKSQYSVIATTDADCFLPANWLKNISANALNNDMLLGPIVFKNEKGFLSNFQVLDMLAIQGIQFGLLNYNIPILNNAANLAYKKNAFEDVGGYDNNNTPSGDDIFLLERFVRSNKKVKGLLAKDYIVETSPERTLKTLFNQRLRWASKAKFYTNKMLLYLSSIILLENLALLFIYVALSLVENYSAMLIILLLSKWLIDFILLLLVASFFEKRRALYYFIPVQLLYPLYIVIIGIASVGAGYNWKGRKFNG